jgi:hypothetical protein
MYAMWAALETARHRFRVGPALNRNRLEYFFLTKGHLLSASLIGGEVREVCTGEL